MSSEIPQDLLYTNEHEWLRLDGDVALVGITQFAAEQLGDVVSVELPEEGDDVIKGDMFGTIESVKTLSDLFAPLSGEVVEVNTSLEDEPERVNDDCWGEGWMIAIEPAAPATDLLDAAAYAKLLEDADH